MELRSAFLTSVGLGLVLGLVGAEVRTARLATNLAAAAVTVAVPVEVRWDIPVVRNDPVERFITLFEQEQSDRMALYLKRSGRYEGMIRGKLRERGMPEDLFYLSMIESGFNPTARSKAQAVGLWQFIASTARLYGLRVDRYVDERRDPERSTDAALRYLQDLHDQFGSWNLAAAAYNTGGGRVSRIMRQETGAERGVEADFWRIRHLLPRETRDYVPLLYAAALIGKEPGKYGLDGVERLLPVPTDTVDVPGGTDLGVVARAVGITEEELKKLNPELVGGVTPPGEPYGVAVPDARAPVFAARFSRATADATLAGSKAAETKKASTSARDHRVKPGESLWSIARRHGVSVTALQRANDLGGRTLLRPGQSLRIPAA